MELGNGGGVWAEKEASDSVQPRIKRVLPSVGFQRPRAATGPQKSSGAAGPGGRGKRGLERAIRGCPAPLSEKAQYCSPNWVLRDWK